ncbi:Eri1 [Kluyveromyces lactis]|nr:Eri1 [Kluyveromyces lactis]
MGSSDSNHDINRIAENKRIACILFGLSNLIFLVGLSSMFLCWNRPEYFYYCSVVLLLPVTLWLWSVISWSASQYFAYGKYRME